jgi:Flp pilus assembly protein TadG
VIRTSWRWVRSAVGSLYRDDYGSSLVEVAIMMPVLMLLLIGVVDISQGYYYAIEVSDAAEAGAVYGSQNLTDTAGMQSAAVLDAPNLKGGVTASASYGCECPDGSGRVVGCAAPPGSCASSYVAYVQVSTSWSYTPLFPYPGIPSSYVLQGLSVMREAP